MSFFSPGKPTPPPPPPTLVQAEATAQNSGAALRRRRGFMADVLNSSQTKSVAVGTGTTVG